MNKKLCFALIFFGLVSGALSSQASADTFVYSGGCFWCTEADAKKLTGVSEVISHNLSHWRSSQMPIYHS
ncbi:MAG: hypothetical protein ACPHV1_07060 [Candidatus Puniceispirillaceae bacterium]